MISDLTPYPEYTDSGLHWLGGIPTHWRVRRLGQMVRLLVSNVDKHTVDSETPVRLCNYVDVYKNDVIRSDMPFMRASATADEVSRFRLKVGDVLITKDSEDWEDIAVPALVVSEAADLLCGYHLAILRPATDAVQGSYLHRCLQSEPVAWQFRVAANGVTRYGLSHGAIKDALIPVPPPGEQLAIVRFLDHADRRIRRYIGAKRKLIALLNEQKQAIIHQAVTRGVDPNVRLQPSGVDWLGDVPEHWEVLRLKTLLSGIDQGISPQAEARLAGDGAWGVLKSGCVNHGIFKETEHKRLPHGFRVDEKLTVHEGDVLVSRACGSPRLVGSVGRVRSLNYRLILSDKTFRLLFREPRIVDFIVAAMNSRYFRSQVEQAISGAEGLANNLPLSSLRDFLLVIPPPAKAAEIAFTLDGRLNGATRMIETVEREISLMREYRTRLIADVVTGKLDVRPAAAALPKELIEVPDELADADEMIEEEEITEEQPDAELAET